MNLAYKYPLLFWNCACLITDSGGTEDEDEDNEEDNIIEDSKEDEVEYDEIEEFDDDDDNEEETEEEEDTSTKVKKKPKAKATNYGKIASAIGKLKANKVDISAPDINKSGYTFSPDIEFHRIRFGLSGITRIGKELIKTIMDNRPYTSIIDFTKKVKVNKPQMVNLIKSGAFDIFGDRFDVMREYLISVSEVKNRITLQNMSMLINFNLILKSMICKLRFITLINISKNKKMDIYYGLDNITFEFYEKHFPFDLLILTTETESGFKIKQVDWDKIYQSHMNIIRPFVQKNNKELLTQVNNRIISDIWNKYAKGSISKWEMDSISCYIHEHELVQVKAEEYGFSDFAHLPEEPEIDYYFMAKGKKVLMYRLRRIIGTVLDRNKTKKYGNFINDFWRCDN